MKLFPLIFLLYNRLEININSVLKKLTQTIKYAAITLFDHTLFVAFNSIKKAEHNKYSAFFITYFTRLA
ncbi:hypothetical protein UB35_10200 [Photobacterium angustum]|nr:hypothetical protein UB35_10200 [Photobacterium angustum]PSV69616.1 hypothetical protein CTM95_01075 [Photobacterium angustum]